ncbi:MAG: Fpg/Nei family DNA glycosylase [Ilumatobacteraceae bacterium]
MPEGHTIHRIAKDHAPLLAGRAVAVSSPQGRFEAGARLVDGVRLDRIEAYGKHLFYHWSNGRIGHVHLGLFGRFRVHRTTVPPEPQGQVRMRMTTDLATIDLSGPTDCSIGTPDDREAIVDRLGPDPLRSDADRNAALARIARSTQSIGQLLLDQRVLAGVGNVYRAEALFVNGINPERRGVDCDAAELQALWTTVVSMLRQGVRDNRIITVDRREFDVPRGRVRRGESTYVYHRDRCLRCGDETAIAVLGGRDCWYCPTCQPT